MLTSKNTDERDAATSLLNTVKQDIGQREMVSMDPVTGARDIIRRLHNKGQDIVQKGMMFIVDWLGTEGMIIVSAMSYNFV